MAASEGFRRWLVEVWPLSALNSRRKAKIQFHKEGRELLEAIKTATGDSEKAIRELRATADAAVRRIEQAAEQAVAKSKDPEEESPSQGERLCIELLKHWRLKTNWKTNAITTLEALADKGKGNLAQWGAKELLSEDTITLSTNRGMARDRLTQLAVDGTQLPKSNARNPAQGRNHSRSQD